MTSLNEAWLDAALEVYHLFVKKNANYSPNNIAKTGAKGVVIRLSDKIERLVQLVLEGQPDLVGEDVRDTVMDIADYAIILMLVLDGKWPKYQRRVYEDQDYQYD